MVLLRLEFVELILLSARAYTCQQFLNLQSNLAILTLNYKQKVFYNQGEDILIKTTQINHVQRPNSTEQCTADYP